jgi:hypothetical protein
MGWKYTAIESATVGHTTAYRAGLPWLVMRLNEETLRPVDYELFGAFYYRAPAMMVADSLNKTHLPKPG